MAYQFKKLLNKRSYESEKFFSPIGQITNLIKWFL